MIYNLEHGRPVLNDQQREYMTQFVTELRSGKYHQIQNRLRLDGYYFSELDEIGSGFCCLGVMTEVGCSIDPGIVAWDRVGRAYRWTKRIAVTIDHGTVIQEGEDFEDAVLPFPIAQLFGITDGQLIMPCDTHKVDPAWLNDDQQWNFDQIADAFAHTYLGEPYPDGTLCPECTEGR